MSKNAKIILIVGLIILVCISISACCIIIFCFAYFGDHIFRPLSEVRPTVSNSVSALAVTVTPAPGRELSIDSAIELDPTVIENYNNLASEVIPTRDLVLLASKFGTLDNASRTIPGPTHSYSIGDKESFWILDSDTNEYLQVKAVLRYETPHAYYWIQDKVSYDKSELIELAETFESQIYPVNREFFGEEWNPGIDKDEHIFILYTNGLGDDIAGLFPTENSYVKEVFPFSNEHEMFLIDASQDLNDPFTYGVLAHEFQHMIHWYRDLNEDNWLNEGMADLAMFLNGYDVGGFDFIFSEDPDLQLNYWPEESEAQDAHYGASFLFFNYILGRFGEDLTKTIIASSQNGFESIDVAFEELGINDSLTGESMTSDKVFTEWTITNYLHDPYVGDGRYTYKDYELAPQVTDTEIVKCPIDRQDRSVSQYGTDYIRLKCDGDYELNFSGSEVVKLVSVDPHSGKYFFWSNFGDESDMTLTREFDFTKVTGPIVFKYWAAFDIENDYDYLYLLASEDGRDWKILEPTSCTNQNPTGANYGCGYNGTSNGWIEESVDLSEYAGKTIYLQFEYITDAVVSRDGFLLDDMSIPAIGYTEDFEHGDGGWEGKGFARIQNSLPQIYSLSLIQIGEKTQVQNYVVKGTESISLPIKITQDEKLILVVSGLTRFTRQPAWYSFNIH